MPSFAPPPTVLIIAMATTQSRLFLAMAKTLVSDRQPHILTCLIPSAFSWRLMIDLHTADDL